MTLTTAASTQPTLGPGPGQHANPSDQDRPPHGILSERGYSDSVLPSCRMSTGKHQQVLEDASLKVNPSTLLTPDTSTGDLTDDKATPQSKRMKAKQDLRLPSFRSLGIAAPHPSALLTPPDENTLRDLPAAPTSTTSHPRSLSFPQAALPKTPDLVDRNTAPIQAVEGVTPKRLALMMNEPQDTVTPTGKGPAGSAVDDTIVADQAAWASKAIDVASE